MNTTLIAWSFLLTTYLAAFGQEKPSGQEKNHNASVVEHRSLLSTDRC
jgi:hypothetical protein